jgi:hypothetical protein
MANITRTLADTAGFIPQDWANEALQVLRNKIVLAPVLAKDTDFEDPGWKGKQITVPYAGTFTAQDKVPGSLATVQTPNGGTSVVIPLSKHKTVDYILEDIAFSQAKLGQKMAAEYGKAAGIAIAEQFEFDLISQLANLNPSLTTVPNGSLGTIGTNWNAALVQAAQKALDDQKTPDDERYLFYGTKDRNALLADSQLSTWYAFAQQKAIGEGAVPGIYGFDKADYSQLLPTVFANLTPSNIQIVTISGGATGGNFTLTYGGQTTAAIPFGAGITTPASIAQALQALTSIPAGGLVFVTGAGLGPFTIWLVPPLGGSWTPTALTGSAAGLTGGTPALNVTNGATNGQLGVALHKDAILYATRPLENVSSVGVEVAFANDPMSGISLRIQMQYQPQYRGVYVAYDILYGMGILRASQGVLIAS